MQPIYLQFQLSNCSSKTAILSGTTISLSCLCHGKTPQSNLFDLTELCGSRSLLYAPVAATSKTMLLVHAGADR